MKINEILTEDELNELNWRKGMAAAALGAAALTGMGGANARVTPGQDPGVNRLTGQPNITQVAPDEVPGGVLPNQGVDTVDKVDRDGTNVTITHGGKEYKAIFIDKDAPTPRGGKIVKVKQAQLGERGIGNYTTYLLPNGSAYIYK